MKAAILVGCSQYDDDDLADLRFAHKDAEDLARTLECSCGIDPDDIFSLASEPAASRGAPTKAGLLRVLAKGPQISDRVKIETLYFAFSGHGCHSIETGLDYLLFKDTVFRALEDSALDYQTLIRYLRRWNARHTIILLDACRSYMAAGKAAEGSASSALSIDSLCPDGMITFCSCSPGQKSYEAEALKQGIFTASVIRAFGDEGRCGTVYELDQFLVRDVPHLSRLQGKPIQKPFSRVEPLGAQAATLVSVATLTKWMRDLPLGPERRMTPDQPSSTRAWAGMMGIDFGTSTSLATLVNCETGDVILSRLNSQAALIPSVLSFYADLSYVVGEPAVQRQRFDPSTTAYGIKRALGSQDILNVFGRSIIPETAASLLIRSMKRTAELYTDGPINSALVSYPVNFTTKQLNSLVKAYQLAGFEHIRLMPEPCAAALAVHHAHFKGHNDVTILVIDLGGGTLDVAVVSVGHNVVEAVCIDGDRNLGGIDYDIELSKLLRMKAASGLKSGHSSVDTIPFRIEAETVKIQLTAAETGTVIAGRYETETGDLIDVVITVTRDEARVVFRDLDNKVNLIVTRVLSKLDPSVIVDAVALAGQGTRTFSLNEMMRSRFADKTLITEFQDSAVGRGLGSYLRTLRGRAQSTIGNDNALLLNASTRDYGIRCVVDEDNGLLELSNGPCVPIKTLVACNTIVPSRREFLCRFSPESDMAIIEVFERLAGESDHQLIGRLSLPEARLEDSFLLAIQTDVEGSVAITVEYPDKNSSESFQLSHFHMVPEGYLLPKVESSAHKIVSEEFRRLVKKPKNKGSSLLSFTQEQDL